jgi:hypothetical protein
MPEQDVTSKQQEAEVVGGFWIVACGDSSHPLQPGEKALEA